MGKFIDMTGWVMSEHGVPESRLTVIKRIGSTKDHRALWECQCQCGNITMVDTHSLTSGNVKSCGCRIWRAINPWGGEKWSNQAISNLERNESEM
mgnify:CR=1 FL=1